MTNVVVRNGVVELWGTITDDRERQALIAACENVLASEPCMITWSGSSPIPDS
jgi:hypothetical protein